MFFFFIIINTSIRSRVNCPYSCRKFSRCDYFWPWISDFKILKARKVFTIKTMLLWQHSLLGRVSCHVWAIYNVRKSPPSYSTPVLPKQPYTFPYEIIHSYFTRNSSLRITATLRRRSTRVSLVWHLFPCVIYRPTQIFHVQCLRGRSSSVHTDMLITYVCRHTFSHSRHVHCITNRVYIYIYIYIY